MTVLEYIKQLSNTLTPQQRAELAKYLEKPNGKTEPGKRVSLRGIWKGKFPDDVDTEALLREIRSEWKEELDLYT